MELPKPLNEAEIDEIKAKYARLCENAGDVEKITLQLKCDEEVAAAIARQRQDAIDAGGPLGERVKAENERMKAEAEALMASIQPEIDRINAEFDPQIEAAADMQEKLELMQKKAAAQAEIYKTIL